MKKEILFLTFLFLLPLALTSASLLGPLSGLTVSSIFFILFFLIIVLEILGILKLKYSAGILLSSIMLSMILAIFVTANSPEAKVRRAQEEAERQKIIKSQTLLGKEPMEEIQATVLNSPELVDNRGSLLVMRVKFESHKEEPTPRMVFVDTSICRETFAFRAPLPGSKVKITPRKFRSIQFDARWIAHPGMTEGSVIYFAEPTCG